MDIQGNAHQVHRLVGELIAELEGLQERLAHLGGLAEALRRADPTHVARAVALRDLETLQIARTAYGQAWEAVRRRWLEEEPQAL